MKLSEVLTQVRALVTAGSTQAVSEAQDTETDEKVACTSITTSGLDKGSSQKKFEALKAYLTQTGKVSDPLLTQLIQFLDTELQLLSHSDTIDPSKATQVHALLNQLLEVPLAHEQRLNFSRQQLSVNKQATWKPEDKENDEDTKYRAKPKEAKFIPLPEKVSNGNGKTIKPLDKPTSSLIQELVGEIVFEIPTDSKLHPTGIQATKQKEALIDPEHHLIKNKVGKLLESDYLADYGVKWDRTKCIRDLFQNFLDSHGLTLEGVKIRIQRKSKSEPYVIRVEGFGEFHPEYVEKTGATTKKGSNKSAGGFGEGAKILSLVFLRDHNVNQIAFSSRNWKMEYTLGEFVSGNRGLFRKLDIADDRPGNYVEITTTDTSLVNEIVNGVDLFYHPHNTDFSNPTFENEVGGFKYLGRESYGNAYPLRQRYEIESDSFSGSRNRQWCGGLKQLSVWTNKRVGHWEPDRDRTAISSGTVTHSMLEPIIESMSDEELIKSIKLLEEFWSRNLAYYDGTIQRGSGLGMMSMSLLSGYQRQEDPNTIGPASSLLSSLIGAASKRGIITKFEDKCLAIPPNHNGFPHEYLVELRKLGFSFYATSFSSIGMPKAEEVYKALSEHKPLKPTENEVKQINILKEAATVLRKRFLKSHMTISEHDIAKPVYIFDREERLVNKDALAEYQGQHVWFDRNFLGSITFERGLAAYLHEVTHKYGGDETAVFSYKLTDWLDLVMKGLNDPETKEKFDDLRYLWQEAIPEDSAQHSEDVQYLSGMIRSATSALHTHVPPTVKPDLDVLSIFDTIGKMATFAKLFGKKEIQEKGNQEHKDDFGFSV